MRIWIDIDNAPHVPVLFPLIREFQSQGHEVEVTARDYGQTLPLLDLYGLKYRAFSRHAGANRLRKAMELARRSAALYRWARGRRFDVAFAHGARAIVMPARALGVPLVYMTDYEPGADLLLLRGAARILVPHAIPDAHLAAAGFRLEKVRKFSGFKEELYVYDFEPDAAEIEALGLDLSRPIVLLRPPATAAMYHADESLVLFHAAIGELSGRVETQVLVLPRTEAQRRELEVVLKSDGNFVFPGRVVHGANLVWHADAVVGGGGTMNREAACMGVPVFSIFRGPLGAVDRQLEAEGRLVMVADAAALRGIPRGKQVRAELAELRERGRRLRREIADLVMEVAA